jgi:hypothetical protein
MGYRDIIELTGSPAKSEQFMLGRVRTMIIVNFILVGIYAFEQKWRDILGPTSNIQQRSDSSRTYTTPGSSFLQCNRLQPQWLLYLSAILNAAILADMFINQSLMLTLPLLSLLAGVVITFVVFNMCWNISIPEHYKDS